MFSELSVILGRIREARRSVKLSRDEVEQQRLAKFRALVRFANEKAPFYTKIIAERGIDIDTCTPADFPLLTKSILMANFDDIVTDKRITKKAVSDFLERSKDPAERFLGSYRVMHTSGTSGEVGYFLYSSADWLRGLMSGNFRRRRRMMGRRKRVRGGRYRVAFYGATGGHFAGVTMATSASRGLPGLFVDVKTFEINSPLPGTIERLNAFQPDVLGGYTAALRMLGEKQREGVLKIAPRAIAATGETCTSADMAFLRDCFGGAEVTSAYGCTEHLALGRSDPGGETMTLNDSSLIFEFHEDHSVITNLFNYTMPLIRYRMSDILIPVLLNDPDDRRLVVRNVVGRTERMPIFLNAQGASDFISPHIINEVFVPGVARFQMHLTGATSFRFLVVLDATLDAPGRARAVYGVKSELDRILAQKSMSNVKFEVAPVADLPVDPRTRKFRLIIDERPDDWAHETVSAA